MFFITSYRAWPLYGLLIAAFVAACSPAPKDIAASVNTSTPQRVVSLDFCADQYALELLPRSHILALSRGAASDFSYHKDKAVGLPTVRPRTEDILALKPDLIIRSYGGDPQAERFYESLDIPVINIGWAAHMNGEAAGSVIDRLRRTAQALGQEAAGEAVIETYKQRLHALETLKPKTRGPHALYLTPYGVTTGPNSLIHDIIELAGFTNFQTRAGWHPLPLERLTRQTPDYVITGFFDTAQTQLANWSTMRHPIAQNLLASQPTIALKGAWTSCGAWFLLDAAEALSRAKTLSP